MITAKTIEVGTDPVDLTAGTGTSAVSVQYLRNGGDTVLFLGDAPGGVPIDPGQTFPGQLALGATDRLHVAREEGSGPVFAVLGWG